jgi:glyoxylase-like metal-dependent hydrolase (beta-lactamase superfamily II)
MQGSTVVIVPPNGDMQDYLNSLALLLQYPIAALAPAHGQIILQPQAEIDKLIKHRQLREARTVSAMQRIEHGSLDEITPLAYSDVDPELHRIARYSLWAHLLKLQKEGRVAEHSGDWRWLG